MLRGAARAVVLAAMLAREAAGRRFTGRACVNDRCYDDSEITAAQLSWRALLRAAPAGVPGCHVRGRTCDVAVGKDPPVRCKEHRHFVGPCLMPPASAQSRGAARACSGSIGEEHFVVHRYFGAANGSAARGGTFIELGANDGLASNTLYLERCLGWSGLLIEGQPRTFARLRANRPASVAVGSAICDSHGYTNFTVRKGGDPTAGIFAHMSKAHVRRWRIRAAQRVSVPCGPLGDWLSLLGMDTVDFFSLDVEGAELMVLGTVDWAKLSVRVLLAECKRVGCVDVQDNAVAALLGRAGLERAGVLRARHDIWDAVYVNRTALPHLFTASPFDAGAVNERPPPV